MPLRRSLFSVLALVPFVLGSLLVLGVASGCVSAADRPAREAEPPPPLPEIHYAEPAPGMVWVPGSWHWSGTQYVWVPGRWEAPPVPIEP